MSIAPCPGKVKQTADLYSTVVIHVKKIIFLKNASMSKIDVRFVD
jgi:hypothetical protein